MSEKDVIINLKIVPESKKDLDLLNLYLVKNKIISAGFDLYITQKDVDNFECKIKKELKKNSNYIYKKHAKRKLTNQLK